jgi:hypothetical protein
VGETASSTVFLALGRNSTDGALFPNIAKPRNVKHDKLSLKNDALYVVKKKLEDEKDNICSIIMMNIQVFYFLKMNYHNI